LNVLLHGRRWSVFTQPAAELGRLEEARAEAAEVLKISPNFSLEKWRQITPYKDQAEIERMLAALRRAGLK
jgi:adenylate cyclase